MSADLVPTAEQRLAFARALLLTGRLDDGRAPVNVCRGCHRPWPLDALTYAHALDAVASAPRAQRHLFIRHPPCGTLQMIPRST